MSSHSTPGAGPSSGTGLHGAAVNLQARRRPVEAVIKGALLICGLLSVAITIGIVAALIEPVLHFFAEVPLSDFFATSGQFAVLPLVGGTLMVTAIALLVAVPLGLGAATPHPRARG